MQRWTRLRGWGFVLVIAATTVAASRADGPALAVNPSRFVLRGPEAVQQLVVEAPGPLDRTAAVRYESSDPAVATVDDSGLVAARGDGEAVIRVVDGARRVEVPVSVVAYAPGPPIHFGNQIVPIFTKLGCNAGGCHGKASGQNGFRLSLLGFEPELDYETLVHEARGRRVFPAAPERSLLLEKAVASVPHGGGKKLDRGSHEYRLIVRWIASGMPVGRADEPALERVEVYPPSRTLARGGAQQLAVRAYYADGRSEDVTRWAQYQSNEPDVASVAEGGRVEARDLSGQAAVMARYQGRIAVFRATVPLGGESASASASASEWDFRPANVLDELAAKQWRALGLAPSPPCTDAEFLRRAALDLTGTMPTAEEVAAFVADPAAGKRAALIDRLLARPEYASFFATKWADILRNQREGRDDLKGATYRFHDWIRNARARNVPYDRFAREVLSASGTPETAPAVLWSRRLRTPDAFVDDAAQVFLGMRLQCAKCHHHPLETWSQEDYYGFAAFFARVGRKGTTPGEGAGRGGEAIFTARSGEVRHPKTGAVLPPRGLGGAVVAVAPGEDPRAKLADWMTDPKNPYFARALANRYWAHFFGRGLVEPLDDLRLTNPASNPELLDALADSFVRSGYDLKALIRLITTSGLYGLSSAPNATNGADRQSFARAYPRRLPAEVLHDAIAQVTGSPTGFAGLPAGTRAIELPDESVASTFLDTFGRPKRESACACERVTDASLGQSLLLLNSAEIQGKLAAGEGRAAALAKDPRPDAEKVEVLFLAAFARPPSSTERAAALDHVARDPQRRQEAYEDILWALVNAKEFQFND
jgi:hypothetical protein